MTFTNWSYSRTLMMSNIQVATTSRPFNMATKVGM